jgi:hypothetical protein
MTRTPRPLAALAMAAVIAAGCSDGSARSGATGWGAGAATGDDAGAGGDRKATDRDKAVRFAECMRNNGLADFPDPDAKGRFAYGVGHPAAFRKAVDACKALQPPGSLSAKRSPDEQTASLRFARCMRDNGVKDFPDPANGEPLVDTTKIPSTDRDGGMTILNAAMQTCRGVMDEAAADR